MVNTEFYSWKFNKDNVDSKLLDEIQRTVLELAYRSLIIPVINSFDLEFRWSFVAKLSIT